MPKIPPRIPSASGVVCDSLCHEQLWKSKPTKISQGGNSPPFFTAKFSPRKFSMPKICAPHQPYLPTAPPTPPKPLSRGLLPKPLGVPQSTVWTAQVIGSSGVEVRDQEDGGPVKVAATTSFTLPALLISSHLLAKSLQSTRRGSVAYSPLHAPAQPSSPFAVVRGVQGGASGTEGGWQFRRGHEPMRVPSLWCQGLIAELRSGALPFSPFAAPVDHGASEPRRHPLAAGPPMAARQAGSTSALCPFCAQKRFGEGPKACNSQPLAHYQRHTRWKRFLSLPCSAF